jgi:L-lactate dehydrogenase complex protein LldG
MSARDNILARVRRGLNLPGNVPGLERAEVLRAIDANVRGPRPTFDWTDQAERFALRSKMLSSSVDRVATLSDVPAAVARYLNEWKLPPTGVAWPALSTMAWGAAGVELEFRGAEASDLVGITGAFCAIAETGTLMLLSGPDTPAAVSLLPETHIAILDVSRIVPGMEEAWALLKAEQGSVPRAVNFVSGPSRTADIEQTIVIGAHGPYRVHVILVGS